LTANRSRKIIGTEDLVVPWLVLVMVLLMVGGYIFHSQYAEYRRVGVREQERLVIQAKVVEDNLVLQLQGLRLALEGIRNDIPYWRQDNVKWERASHRLEAMSEAMPGLRTFIITNAAGTVTAANRPRLIGKNFRFRDYFQAPRNQPDPNALYISPPFKTSLGVVAINVGRTITGPNGQFAGVVSATLSPEYFSVLLGSVLYAPDMGITLSHGNGQLFLELPVPAGTRAAPSSDKERLVVRREIQPPGLRMDKPLVVAVSRDLAAPYGEWRHDTLIIFSLFVGFACTLGVGLYLFQRRQLGFRQRVLQFELAQQEHAELFRKIAGQVPGAIFQFRLHPDGTTDIPYASDAIGALFHVNVVDVQQSAAAVFAAIHPDDRAQVAASIQESARQLTQWDCQFRVRYADAAVRWLHGMSAPQRGARGEVLWHGFVTDVTGRKQDEVALRGNERFLKTLTEALPGLISYWTRELVCTFANRGYSIWFGKSQEEMAGIRMQELLGDELFRMDEQYINEALNGRGSRFERCLTKPDGEIRNIWVPE
jgi:PAS domain-containing protein